MSASYAVYKILRESGLPPNIIQFVPADGPVFGDTITSSEHLAGINFTGSVPYVSFYACWLIHTVCNVIALLLLVTLQYRDQFSL